MKRISRIRRMMGIVAMAAFCLGAQAGAEAQSVAARVVSDAVTIDRVAEVSRRDLPAALLKRIVEEDIELLRGPRADGTYEYATWERFEASRLTKDFSIQPRGERMESVEMRGENVYRVIIGIPKRRLLVRPNRPVWIERVDVDYVGEGTAQSRQSSIAVKEWVQPGQLKPVDLPTISRQATVRVIATADAKAGYGNIDVALVQAKIVDSSLSPYAAAVTQAKALRESVEERDIELIRTGAQRMRMALDSQQPRSDASVTVSAARAASMSAADLENELREIDALLRGSESERSDGLERLQGLIRRVGP